MDFSIRDLVSENLQEKYMSDFKEIILNQKCALNQAEKPSFKAHFSAFRAIFVYIIDYHITVQIHDLQRFICHLIMYSRSDFLRLVGSGFRRCGFRLSRLTFRRAFACRLLRGCLRSYRAYAVGISGIGNTI